MASEARKDSETKPLFDSRLWAHAENLAAGVAEAVSLSLNADEVQVIINNQSGADKQLKASYHLKSKRVIELGEDTVFSLSLSTVRYQGFSISSPMTVNDVARARLPGDLAQFLSKSAIKSLGLFKLERGGVVYGLVACFYTRAFHRWSKHEAAAFEQLGRDVVVPISNIDQAKSVVNQDVAPKILSASSKQVDRGSFAQYQSLASRGNIVILTTDRDFGILDIFGNSEELLGISADQLRGDPAVWGRIVDSRDVPKLMRQILRMRTTHGVITEDLKREIQEEVRITHQRTGEVRWILLRALPYYDDESRPLGWEGFGVDVTDRRKTEERLIKQNARLEALFEVSRSIGDLRDPATITLNGLRAVISATRSECGYGVFRDRESNILDVVAAVGLSEEYLSQMEEVLTGPSLLTESITKQVKFLIPDLQSDSRAVRPLAELEQIRSTIVVPLVFEGMSYGALVLFKRTANSYDDDDFELAVALASQITLVVRQAELLDLQRRQSASLGSLYKVSRELAKYRSSVDYAEQILPVLRDEFALNRIWLGTINDQGTFLVGRAGIGSNLNTTATTLQIEISDRESILDELLQEKLPIVLDDPSVEPYESILGLFNDPRSLVVVPMVSIGQVMGVLVLEPLSKDTFTSSERLQLLVSMANEMATAMMAGRFDSKMSNAVKMRTAGLLASGVAHNFNNILQAIIGQVSLIQLQSRGNPQIQNAAHTIQEAAMRGASLVSQLLSFAAKGAGTRAMTDITRFILDATDLYRSLLGSDVVLSIHSQLRDGVQVKVDVSQISQVITSILANARDALNGLQDGEVNISLHSVIISSSDMAVDLSPGHYVRIDLRDNGVGMEEEGRYRCFEPFYTTKNVDRDTGVGLSAAGLGLSAAYAIVKEHDGVITAHSKKGEGSIFSVYLPAYNGEASGANLERIQDEVKGAGGVLMLGVEAGAQPFLASAFESLGYGARGVFDLRQAEDLIKRDIVRWGVLLVDRDNVAASDRWYCEQLIERYSELAVVYIVNHGEDVLPKEREYSGARKKERIYYVERPVTGWGLEGVLARIKAGRGIKARNGADAG